MQEGKDFQLQVFSEGQTIELSDVNIESLKHISGNLNLNQQFDLLISHFTSLVKTVNINAAFLRHSILKSKEKKPAEEFLYEVVEQFILSMQKLEPSSAPTYSTGHQRASIAHLNKDDWGTTLNDYTEACKLIVKGISKATDKQKIEELASKCGDINKTVDDIKVQGLETQKNIQYIQNEMVSLHSLKDIIYDTKNEIERKAEAFLSLENLHTSPVIENLKDRLNNVEESLLNLSNKISLLSTNLSALAIPVSLPRSSEQVAHVHLLKEIEDFRENNDQIYQKLEEKILQVEEDLTDKLEKTLERYQKVAIDPAAASSISTKGQNVACSDDLRWEVEHMLQKQEKAFSKRLLTLENSFKDLGDWRKYEKMIQKIQIELNAKVGHELFNAEIVGKVDRNEFFDFVNKNLVSTDQMKTFNLELVRTNRDFKEKTLDTEFQLKKLRKIIENGLNESKYQSSVLSENTSELLKRINGCEGDISQIGSLFKEMEKDQSNFRATIYSLLNQRINSLATTKALRCLSCGQKDIPYPSQICYIQGENKQMYIKNLKEDSVSFTAPDDNKDAQNNMPSQFKAEKKDNDENHIISKKPSTSMTKFCNKKNFKEKRLMSAVGLLQKFEPLGPKRFSAFPRREYATGQQMSTPQQTALEHNITHHSKTDPYIETREASSPFSAALKNPLFRIA